MTASVLINPLSNALSFFRKCSLKSWMKPIHYRLKFRGIFSRCHRPNWVIQLGQDNVRMESTMSLFNRITSTVPAGGLPFVWCPDMGPFTWATGEWTVENWYTSRKISHHANATLWNPKSYNFWLTAQCINLTCVLCHHPMLASSKLDGLLHVLWNQYYFSFPVSHVDTNQLTQTV